MGTVDFQTQNTFDRRIGRRLVLDGIDVINVTWMVPQRGRFGRPKPPLELAGRIENVSITGAAIVGPSELSLSTGDEAVIRCGGRDNIVSVRHAEPCGDDRTTRYGVEITSVQPNLKRRIQELLDPTLARLPVEAPAPGRLSLRGGVARPTVRTPTAPPTPEVVAPTEASARRARRARRGARPGRRRHRDPDAHGAHRRPRGARPHRRHHGRRGRRRCARPHRAGGRGRTSRSPLPRWSSRPDRGPEPDGAGPLIEPEPVSSRARHRAEPVIAAEPVIEPEPVIEAEAPGEPSTARRVIDPHVPVAHPVHLPPVEMSEGRRVLDEVFGLMDD